jgi:hypothetical protein
MNKEELDIFDKLINNLKNCKSEIDFYKFPKEYNKELDKLINKSKEIIKKSKPIFIGFIGKAGSGKSTLAKLFLMKYYGWEQVFKDIELEYVGNTLNSDFTEKKERELIEDIVNFHFYELFSNDDCLISFAEPVKKIAVEQFGWNGLKDDKGRKLLQLIGTDVGRGYNEAIWINIALKKYNDIKKQNNLIVIDDVRFLNEAKFIKENKGILVRVNGKNNQTGQHKSETEMDSIIADIIVNNDEVGFEHLEKNIDYLYDTIVEKDAIIPF